VFELSSQNHGEQVLRESRMDLVMAEMRGLLRAAAAATAVAAPGAPHHAAVAAAAAALLVPAPHLRKGRSGRSATQDRTAQNAQNAQNVRNARSGARAGPRPTRGSTAARRTTTPLPSAGAAAAGTRITRRRGSAAGAEAPVGPASRDCSGARPLRGAAESNRYWATRGRRRCQKGPRCGRGQGWHGCCVRFPSVHGCSW